ARARERGHGRGRARRPDEHGLDAAARAGGRGGAARADAQRRGDRVGRRAGRRGHRAAGRPQRDARLQAPPRARAVRPGAQGGRRSNVGGMDWTSVGEVREALGRERYLADDALSTALFLAGAIDQPLLLEGEAGVGKTETARAAASARGARLVRLQCHEGIDVHHALYDWDWSRQLLALRAAEHGRPAPQLYSREFLVRRPLLEALEADDDVVLLIDEVDRADDAFEAFLLE